jgi:hypothetical protein
MENLKYKKEWITIPVLPSVSIIDTLSFWEIIGYKVTFKQTRPYQYGVVERNGYQLHFVRVTGIDKTNNFSSCLVMVSNIGKVYQEYTQRLKENLGRIPHSGIPRISRMKPGTSRFTLTDVSGNSVIFINYGKNDQETWEKADDKNQSPLKKAISTAIRFRDYKEDEKAAAATLEVALRKAEDEDEIVIAEALIIGIDLAIFMNEPILTNQYRTHLNKLCISGEKMKNLIQKHNVEL